MPTKQSNSALLVENLRKVYNQNQVVAIDQLSFQVRPGDIFGLLGPNGAGKTTTIAILTTRLKPTAGKAFICGVDVVKNPNLAKTLFGVVPQRNNLDRSLSVKQNLLFHATYHGQKKKAAIKLAEELLCAFGLIDRANERPDFFSGGQAQRIMIARALMHEPQVLFLDEPSTGLDPAAKLFLWDRIKELKSKGTTVILTTHDMDEASKLSDLVGIMDHGKLLATGTTTELINTLPAGRYVEVSIAPCNEKALAGLKLKLSSIKGVASVDEVPRDQLQIQKRNINNAYGPRNEPRSPDLATNTSITLRISVLDTPTQFIIPINECLNEENLSLTDINFGEATLEDVFIHLTGRALR